jgi:formate dehydrogenase subunit gamma
MLKARVRLFGALVLGAALALPFAASAQAPAAGTKAAPPAAAAPAAEAPKPAEAAPKAAAGSTAVPGWNNPPAWAGSSERPQYASIPGVDTNRLIQGAGREWRAFRNGPETFYGGIILLLPFAALLGFYLLRGAIKVHGAPTGRTIERFSGIERATHWTMAISFVVLAFSGIVILFGKHIVLPWLGYGAFSAITVFSKSLHNFVGPLFMFALVIFIILFLRDNLPKAYDMLWLRKFGGMLSGEHVPSGRFNAGEKALFWSLVAGLCVVLSISGLVLDFPNWNQGRETMQIANVVHGVCAIFAMAMACFHVYLGTIGMEGAYKAMRTGLVDETWAREHHEYWYNEVKAGTRPEKIVGAAPQPAPGDD